VRCHITTLLMQESMHSCGMKPHTQLLLRKCTAIAPLA